MRYGPPAVAPPDASTRSTAASADTADTAAAKPRVAAARRDADDAGTAAARRSAAAAAALGDDDAEDVAGSAVDDGDARSGENGCSRAEAETKSRAPRTTFIMLIMCSMCSSRARS